MNQDQKYIQQCFRLAKKAQGLASPNPMVGCVIVKSNKIIAKGYHHQFGKDHAEIDALKKINFKAKGSILYCNLEPCFHAGKTPACVQSVIKSGVKKVVISNLDPNPLVSGKSIRLLKKSGIEVVTGILEEEGRELNRFFFHWIQSQTPYVILKVAASLDGKISTSSQKQTWLTGKESIKEVHRLRSCVDAVLIGHKTLQVDQAQLNVREVKSKHQPQRIILDSKSSISMDHPIFKSPGGKVTLISGGLKLKFLLKKLGKKDISSLLVEGGGEVFSSFLNQNLVNEIWWFSAPQILGEKSYPAFPNLSKNLKDKFILKEIKKLDQDICFRLIRKD